MPVKVLVKRNTVGTPGVSDLEYGEIAINYGDSAPALFFKQTDGTPANDSVVELKPKSAGPLADLTDVNSTTLANTATDIGKALTWNGTEWIGTYTILSQDTTPTAVRSGDLWFKTDTNELHVWNGTSWDNISAGLVLAVKPAPQGAITSTAGLYHSGYIQSLDSI